MAQQTGIIQFKNKLGNVVGFKNSASLKSPNNFLRQRATSVSNPKTYKQAAQRAKVKPAQMFYNAFESILNHAFKPSAKASINRNRFMSYAMALDAVPDVPKGESYLPLLPYKISEGALGLDYKTGLSSYNAVTLYQEAITMISLGSLSPGVTTTISELSTAILGNNAGLEEGDEITFMLVLTSDPVNSEPQTGRFTAHISFVLDTSNTITTAGDIIESSGIADIGVSNGFLSLNSTSSQGIAALGTIISRKTTNSWTYTNSVMSVTPFGASVLAATESEVIESYMSSDSKQTSDKILQQAYSEGSDAAGSVTIASVTTATVSATGGTVSPTSAAIAVMSDGSRKVIIQTEDGDGTPIVCYRVSTGNYSAITFTPTDSSVSVDLSLARSSLAGNSYINKTQVVAAGF